MLISYIYNDLITHSLFNSHFYPDDISEVGCQHREDKTDMSEEHDRHVKVLSDAISQAVCKYWDKVNLMD